MNHSQWNALLSAVYRQKCNQRRHVRLPSEADIRFSGDANKVMICFSETAVHSNMQTDCASFEGWAVVLMVWCGVKQVAVDWLSQQTSEVATTNAFCID